MPDERKPGADPRDINRGASAPSAVEKPAPSVKWLGFFWPGYFDY